MSRECPWEIAARPPSIRTRRRATSSWVKSVVTMAFPIAIGPQSHRLFDSIEDPQCVGDGAHTSGAPGLRAVGTFLRGSMLPAATALKRASPSGIIGWLACRGVDPLLIGSVLHRLNARAAVAAPPDAKRNRMDGGTESNLRYRCFEGHRAPGSFSRLL